MMKGRVKKTEKWFNYLRYKDEKEEEGVRVWG